MKKVSLVLVSILVSFLFVFADSTIGKCKFVGQRPPHCMSTGNTVIYYNEMSSSSTNSGGTEYKKCKGDVWVIYKSASEPKRIQVMTTGGSVQVCYDF